MTPLKPDVLQALVSLLRPTRLDGSDVFEGQSQDLGWGNVFGGQVLAQALSAAEQTLTEPGPPRDAHSLQAYFLRPGDARAPIRYEVDRTRDGTSFSTRRVVAWQHGKAIFQCAASFQVQETGDEHADDMPAVDGPDGLINERALWQRIAHRLPEPVRTLAIAERPIELRPVDPIDVLDPQKKSSSHAVWLRAAGPLPADAMLHRYLLAYASDFAFLLTALRPHGVAWTDANLQLASIDHCMWFHRPVHIDEWHLHVMHSPSAGGARGFVHGSIFDQQGRLVASTAQEGLMRRRGG
jgi:acyl-CoA thioesterase II